MKLEKFPVIAPDGTEYRVTITEEYVHFIGWQYCATVYTCAPRKLFRFKSVRSNTYRVDGNYSRASGGWLVELAQREVVDYIESVSAKLAEDRGIQSAVEAFRKWDGKITESTEVSE